jgi:hypothetical protein
MKRLLFAVAAVLCVSSGARASITPFLDTVTPDGSDFLFSYHVILSGDEGLTNGSKLVIFDFVGYVPGTVTSPDPAIVATTELSSNFDTSTGGVQTNPLFTDDPTIPNLVFTYIGPDLQATGGPFPDLFLDGFSAESLFNSVAIDGFSGRAVSNHGVGTTGTVAFNNGAVGVAAIPEPAAWSMLVVGFGGAGALLRAARRRRLTGVA